MKVKKGLRALQESDLIPEGSYVFRIHKIRSGGDWEIADCRFVDPEDPELASRRVSYFVIDGVVSGSPTSRGEAGLAKLLAATGLEWGDSGGDTNELEGLEFMGRVYTSNGKRGPESRLDPIPKESDEAEPEPESRASRLKKGSKQAPRRR